MKPTCQFCKYVHATELQADLSRKMFCRRYPPHPIPIINGRSVHIVNVHPTVTDESTCGEFRPLPEIAV